MGRNWVGSERPQRERNAEDTTGAAYGLESSRTSRRTSCRTGWSAGRGRRRWCSQSAGECVRVRARPLEVGGADHTESNCDWKENKSPLTQQRFWSPPSPRSRRRTGLAVPQTADRRPHTTRRTRPTVAAPGPLAAITRRTGTAAGATDAAPSTLLPSSLLCQLHAAWATSTLLRYCYGATPVHTARRTPLRPCRSSNDGLRGARLGWLQDRTSLCGGERCPAETGRSAPQPLPSACFHAAREVILCHVTQARPLRSSPRPNSLQGGPRAGLGVRRSTGEMGPSRCRSPRPGGCLVPTSLGWLWQIPSDVDVASTPARRGLLRLRVRPLLFSLSFPGPRAG
jgi:hypothetical protein